VFEREKRVMNGLKQHKGPPEASACSQQPETQMLNHATMQINMDDKYYIQSRATRG
jgi:hypothetical protein